MHQLAIFSFVFLTMCISPGEDPLNKVPYEISNPTKIFKLSNELEEVSGIALWNDDTLAAINDEDGKIFFLSAKNGEIISTLKFEGAGDYEDVAIFDRLIWVVRSDGKLYKLKNIESNKSDVSKVKTRLNTDNNVEGLCYYAPSNQLWLAFKDAPNLKDKAKMKGMRAVYAFDIHSGKLLNEPVLKFKEDSIMHLLHSKYNNRIGDRFKPSAVEVNPVDGDIYILSAVNGLLLVYDSSRVYKDIIRLPSGNLPQAESLCFDREGNLYIASEGSGGRAHLLFFHRKQKVK